MCLSSGGAVESIGQSDAGWPSMLRRFSKWVGLVVCLLLIAAWGFSEWRAFGYQELPFSFGRSLMPASDHMVAWRVSRGSLLLRNGGGFSWETAYYLVPPSGRAWMPYLEVDDGLFWACIPIWIPLVIVGIPTIQVWRRARRPTPGHCWCGYDLRGNESGKCPECGRAQDHGD